MSRLDNIPAEVRVLFRSASDEILTPHDLAQMEAACDDGVRERLLVDYLQLDADLSMLMQSEHALGRSLQMIAAVSGEAASPIAPCLADVGVAVVLPPQFHGCGNITAAPTGGFLGNALHGPAGYFSQGLVFSYLTAAVLVGLGLLVASLIPAFHREQLAKKSPAQMVPAVVEPKMESVGRITALVDCQWEKEGLGIRDWGLERSSRTRNPTCQSLIPNPQSLVSLGDKYALASGLMEISYHTGAKVILQGPATYEVESNGGFLSLGRLTGKLEKKNDECKMMNDELRTHVSDIHPSSFILHPFSIRTPTATVTDLGTEFGVEVTKDQQSHLHVFQGKVRLRACESATAATSAPREIELSEGETACVAPRGEITRYSGPRAQTAAAAIRFVRRVPRRVLKTLNLVDVVAGGNGFGTARDRGIDPTTGKIADQPASHPELSGDGRYHRVEEIPFVDGVFVPHGVKGPVQLDSAGHAFGGFPNTDNMSFDYIWAGGAIVYKSVLRGIDYAAPWHSVLAMHANKGITFDLEAIRRANPRCKILRFLAVAGNSARAESDLARFLSDIWVFVDGQPRFRRERITVRDGEIKIAVELNDQNRFLSLAVTDGGDTYNWDQVIFGDPRLVLIEDMAAEEKQGENKSRKAME